MANLKALVISDLHAITNKKYSDHSHLLLDGECEFAESLISYISSLNQDIDLLICAGDLSNIGDKDCFDAGWNFVHRISGELNIKSILCTPGNHDHQSRPPNNSEPKYALINSKKPFPTEDRLINAKFINSDWCYLDGRDLDYNCVILNTCAFHGISDEYKHGKVDSNTIDSIIDFTKSTKFPERSINILLCHHHPIKMEHIDEVEDYEAMIGGQQLIHKIHESGSGAWLIIHGHKHFAEISYSVSTGRTPPVIFSAGSLSARIYTGISNRTSNQFYILDIDLEKTVAEGLPVGTFEAHERILSNCWRPSQAKNLPARGGFGSPYTPNQVAKNIKDAINVNAPFLEADELFDLMAPAKNFTPSDFNKLVRILENNGLAVEVENNSILVVGIPYE